jgi:hypothetical protein
MSKKTISKRAKVTGDRLSPSPVGPRKGRMGRASVTQTEKKGKGLARPSEIRSICADCALLYPTGNKKCPMNRIPKQYDIVVFVEECDQWRPKNLTGVLITCQGRPRN